MRTPATLIKKLFPGGRWRASTLNLPRRPRLAFPPRAKLVFPCAPGATTVASSDCFTVAASTAGTASRATIGNTKNLIMTPLLRFLDSYCRLAVSGGNPAATGSPYDFRTTPAAAGESAPHPQRPVALILVGGAG